MNFSLQLFVEAMHKASLVPFGSDTTFYAMKAFGTFSMFAPVALSVIGGIFGHIFNWYAGRTLLFFEHKGHLRLGAQRYERARVFFEKYCIWLLLFCWMPVLNLLTVACGFFKLPLKKVLPLVLVGLVFHYGKALF